MFKLNNNRRVYILQCASKFLIQITPLTPSHSLTLSFSLSFLYLYSFSKKIQMKYG